MIRLILLIQCPNRPESYFQSFERPDDTSSKQSAFSFFEYYKPYITSSLIRTTKEDLVEKN